MICKITITSYLRSRGDFIKVRSVIRVQVFFLHLRAKGREEGATKGAIALNPAEEKNPNEEEQDWDWDPVDPSVRFFICGNVFYYRQIILTDSVDWSWSEDVVVSDAPNYYNAYLKMNMIHLVNDTFISPSLLNFCFCLCLTDITFTWRVSCCCCCRRLRFCLTKKVDCQRNN